MNNEVHDALSLDAWSLLLSFAVQHIVASGSVDDEARTFKYADVHGISETTRDGWIFKYFLCSRVQIIGPDHGEIFTEVVGK